MIARVNSRIIPSLNPLAIRQHVLSSDNCRDSQVGRLSRWNFHWLRWASAFRSGSLEIRIIPPKGVYNSRIKKTAPETAIAHKNRLMMTVALRGANRPSPMKIIVIHETATATSDRDAELLCCSSINQRVCPRLSEVVNAWAFAER